MRILYVNNKDKHTVRSSLCRPSSQAAGSVRNRFVLRSARVGRHSAEAQDKQPQQVSLAAVISDGGCAVMHWNRLFQRA